jgi:hypothetical protein
MSPSKLGAPHEFKQSESNCPQLANMQLTASRQRYSGYSCPKVQWTTGDSHASTPKRVVSHNGRAA